MNVNPSRGGMRALRAFALSWCISTCAISGNENAASISSRTVPVARPRPAKEGCSQ
jgi:hypothetical protein